MGRHNRQQQQVNASNSAASPAPAETAAAAAPVESGSVEEGLALATATTTAEAPSQSGDARDAVAADADAAGERAENAMPAGGLEDGRAVMVECPLKRTGAYATGNISYLPRWVSQELRDLADGLADQGTRLESGKLVGDSRDALIWFAEQLKRGRARKVINS